MTLLFAIDQERRIPYHGKMNCSLKTGHKKSILDDYRSRMYDGIYIGRSTASKKARILLSDIVMIHNKPKKRSMNIVDKFVYESLGSKDNLREIHAFLS